jgi:hypothetical protein
VIKFNRGHDLPFVDHDGVPFRAGWHELRLNPGTHNPFIPVLRGITGLDEVLSLRAYRLAGVPTPRRPGYSSGWSPAPRRCPPRTSTPATCGAPTWRWAACRPSSWPTANSPMG